MPIHAYLDSPPTISTDYRELKIAFPALSDPLSLLLCRARYFPSSIYWLPIGE